MTELAAVNQPASESPKWRWVGYADVSALVKGSTLKGASVMGLLEAADYLNDLERQHATDQAALALLDEVMPILRFLARTDHLMQFSHLKPSKVEQAALDLVARYERLG